MKSLKQTKSNVYYMYTIYDKMAKRYRGTFYHSTDEEMIRTSLPSVLMDYPLRDIEIYRIGMFDDVQGIVRPCIRKQVPTDKYLFPHDRLSSKGDDLSLEEIDVEMKKTKAEIIAKHTTVSETTEERKEA